MCVQCGDTQPPFPRKYVPGADYSSGVSGGHVLRIPASKLVSRTNARPGPVPPDEQRRIDAIARGFLDPGVRQIMPLVVDRGGADEWYVVAGARRLAAARTIDPDYMLDCIVRKEGTDALQVAIHENTRRRGYNAVQYAHLIAAVRAEKGFTGTKEIAAYMGCSRAQVQQHERLLAKPADMSDAVYKSLLADLTGRNTRADAVFFALTHVEPEQAGKVLERAAEIAKSETSAKAPRKQKSATTQPEATATTSVNQESQQSASESVSEPAKTDIAELTVAKKWFEALCASYSGDLIPKGTIRKPVVLDADSTPLVAVSTCNKSCECYELYPPPEFDDTITTYKVRAEYAGESHKDPRGFYHGVQVKSGTRIYVMSGPPMSYVPLEEAEPDAAPAVPPTAPVVQKRHVERAAKEAKAIKKNAPKARGRAAVSTASGTHMLRQLPEFRRLFDTLRGSSYPDPMRSFIAQVNCWWSGDCTDKEVTQHWSQLAMLVEDGLKHSRRATVPAKKKARKSR